MVRFGVHVPVSGAKTGLAMLRKVAGEAEALGFHEVYVNDQITSMQWAQEFFQDAAKLEEAALGRRLDAFESMTTLGFLAAITEKVQLGVHALVPQKRNPITIAKQIANVDQLSKGRLWLAIGIGSVETSQYDFERSFHISFEKRGEVADDYIRALKELFGKPRASFHGRFFHFEDVLLYPKPVQNPLPLWVAARSNRALRRVARFGNGWTLTREFPEFIENGLGVLKKYLSEEGRPDDVQVCYQADTCIAESDDELRVQSAEGLQRVMKQGEATYKREMDASLPAVTRRSFLGRPDHVSSQVERYLQAGANRFKLMFMWKDEEGLLRQMRLFAKAILPSFAT